MQKPKLLKIIEKYSPPKLLDFTDRIGHYMQNLGEEMKSPTAYKVGGVISLATTLTLVGVGLATNHNPNLSEYASNNPVLKPLENIANNISKPTEHNMTTGFFGGDPSKNENILFWRPVTYSSGGGIPAIITAAIYAGGGVLEQTGKLLVKDKKI